MNYLLDTCVVSEFVSPQQSPNVVAWLDSRPLDSLFLSVFSIGEISKGIARLKPSRRRDELEQWFTRIKAMFKGRILVFDEAAAETWGNFIVDPDVVRRTLPIVDTFICAIAIRQGLSIATRNAKDFEVKGVEVFDPWKYITEG